MFLEIILQAAEDSFFGVTVFVGAVLLLFGYLNYWKNGRLIKKIKEKRNWQPLLGAFLGLTPGCGGAILVMPLFMKRYISFGTVVATLIATAGDAAFVLIAGDFYAFLLVSVISFFVAVISGYSLDCLKIGKSLNKKANKEIRKCAQNADRADNIKHIGHDKGDEIGDILHGCMKKHQKSGLGYVITHKFYFIYWFLLAIGLVIGTLQLFRISFENKGVVWFGVFGTLASIILMLAGKKYFSDDTHEEEEIKRMSLKETVIHDAEEVAFVGTWVFIAFFAYEIFVYYVGEPAISGWIVSSGIVSVLIASVVGMIPGCGVQIIMVSLYTKGLLPFAALIAHTISQDGDAIFPLLAMNKKAAFWATVITGVIAFAVGSLFYLLTF